jgi:hypothetical protein
MTLAATRFRVLSDTVAASAELLQPLQPAVRT